MNVKKIKSQLPIESNIASSVYRTRIQNDMPEVLGGEKLRNVKLPPELAARLAEAERIQRRGIATDLSRILIASRPR